MAIVYSWLLNSLHLRVEPLQAALTLRNRRKPVHTYVIAIRSMLAAYILSLL